MCLTDVSFRFSIIPVDFQIAGDNTFNNVHLTSILSSCENELRRNMTLYHYDNETGIVTPPVELLSNICEGDCHKNGDCVNSKFVLAALHTWQALAALQGWNI